MKSDTAPNGLRVGLISLGCAKNLVDSEIMLGALARAGFELINDPTRADAVIVNTCGFIDAAQAESVDAILESAAVRDAHRREQALIVAGCLPQRFRTELPRLLPEVDAFLGVDQVAQVEAIVREALARRREKIQNQFKAQNPNRRTPGRSREVASGRPAAAAPASRLAPLSPEGSPRPAGGHPLPRRGRGQGEGAVPGPDARSPGAAAARPTPLVAVHPRPTYIPDHATPRFALTPPHFAYVKIAEGCNHPCSFCTIPRMRGPHRSRPLADVVRETEQLVARGVRELNLISQDSTFYGLDLWPQRPRHPARPEHFAAALRQPPPGAPTLSALLRALDALPGEFWIRILYSHPAHWTDELIETMAVCRKVARYVDIPLQHIHDNLLERMRRETSRAHIEALLRRIRAGVPGIALRTTFIVGFPGETEACFQSLLDFIREVRFERLGVFTYSAEAGTRAAQMAGQVPDRIKQRRREQVLAAQREIARAHAAAAVGRTLRVLVEGPAASALALAAAHPTPEHGTTRAAGARGPAAGAPRVMVARSEADAPDIDGRVYVRGDLPVGQFARVRVVGHTDYDLVAEPV